MLGGNVMSTITFDTHLFVKRLTSSGMPEQQAEALAEAQKESLSQAMDSSLATKSDLTSATNIINDRLVILEKELLVLKWMTGLIIAGVVSLVLKAFFVA